MTCASRSPADGGFASVPRASRKSCASGKRAAHSCASTIARAVFPIPPIPRSPAIMAPAEAFSARSVTRSSSRPTKPGGRGGIWWRVLRKVSRSATTAARGSPRMLRTKRLNAISSDGPSGNSIHFLRCNGVGRNFSASSRVAPGNSTVIMPLLLAPAELTFFQIQLRISSLCHGPRPCDPRRKRHKSHSARFFSTASSIASPARISWSSKKYSIFASASRSASLATHGLSRELCERKTLGGFSGIGKPASECSVRESVSAQWKADIGVPNTRFPYGILYGTVVEPGDLCKAIVLRSSRDFFNKTLCAMNGTEH